MVILWGLLIAVVLGVIVVISMYNQLVSTRNEVKNA